jgi:hypothetical protein
MQVDSVPLELVQLHGNAGDRDAGRSTRANDERIGERASR